MDPRPPVSIKHPDQPPPNWGGTRAPRPPVSFGPFDAAAIEAEHARAAAGAAFASFRCQATILLTAILSLALAGSLLFVQLARLNAALAACAGV